MDLVLLPGNTVNNKNWIEEVEQSLKPNFSSTNIQFYRHWQTGTSVLWVREKGFDFDKWITNFSIPTLFILILKSLKNALDFLQN